jgi:PKD repeat protein
MFLIALISLAIVSESGISSVRASPDRCWTDKSVYGIGEVVTISFETGGGTTYALVIYKPDGTEVTDDLGPLGSGVYSEQFQAGPPPGQRRVELVETLPPEYVWATCYFDVQPSKLEVSISASPTSGAAPLEVKFSSYVSGGVPPYIYSWDFGDGSGGSSDPNPTHTYKDGGTFTAILKVRDSSPCIYSLPQAGCTPAEDSVNNGQGHDDAMNDVWDS